MAEKIVSDLRQSFENARPRSLKTRINQLKALKRLYEENKNEMCNALAQDLRKSTQEALCMEVDFLINDIKNALGHIHEWDKPERPAKGFANMLDSAYIYNDPYGVVLVIGKIIRIY